MGARRHNGGARAQADVEVLGPYFRALRERMVEYADRRASVLVWGATGTGKELLLRAYVQRVLELRKRATIINCAAIAPNLLDSELFGYRKGAFTGAITDKAGLIESNACLALDELTDATPDFQARLLRVMEHGEYQPVGSAAVQKTDVWLVAAATDPGVATLRRDLVWRFEERIWIPRLWYRRGDLIELLGDFARRQSIQSFTERCLRFLLDHSWLGNAREVRFVVSFAGRRAGGQPVDLDHLPMPWSTRQTAGSRRRWKLDANFEKRAKAKFPIRAEFAKYVEMGEMVYYSGLAAALPPLSEEEFRRSLANQTFRLAETVERLEKHLGISFDRVASQSATPTAAAEAAERAWYAARLAEGLSRTEIAKRTGRTPQGVGAALRRLGLSPARMPA